MSLPTSLAPARPDEAVAYLGACFALVRPVGMSDDHAREWLRVAAVDLSEFPADIIERSCAAARREVTDHRGLVPFVAKECVELLDQRRRSMRPQIVLPALPAIAPEPAPRLSHEDLQILPPMLRRVGLAAGYLTETDDGVLHWTEDYQETAA